MEVNLEATDLEVDLEADLDVVGLEADLDAGIRVRFGGRRFGGRFRDI